MMKTKGADRGCYSAKVGLATSLFILVAFFFLYMSMTEMQLADVMNMARSTFTSNSTHSCQTAPPQPEEEPVATTPDFRLFIGILTQPDRSWHRNILRLAYGTQAPPEDVQIDIKFVFCNLTKEEHKVLVGLEIMLYNDIVILNCGENLNGGKTYTYFSSLPDLLADNKTVNGSARPYDYVMKADDDIYIRLGPLVESLRPMPREDFYYGLSVPCNDMNPYGHFMYGMGYVVSWDIVEWIRESDIPKKNMWGPEDRRVGDWLNEAGRAKNRHNTNPAMYDYNARIGCPRPFSPDTIGVHRLKDQDRWVKAFQYFKVTDGIPPSKLYHLS